MKWLKKVTKWIIILILCFVLGNIAVYTYAKITPKLQIKNANSFSLYDNQKKVFYQGSGSKEWIALKNISPYMINATISTEDKNFYKHKGFDFLRILKAGYTNIVTNSKSQGASTISQQYAKNLFLDFDKTWKRKWDEMWLTIELEAHYSKEEILEGYLNTINYGHGMYGIENASQFYFNKSASDLDLAEAAMLTGIPKSPSYYSPLVNEELAKKRQKNILAQMVKNKYITEQEMKEAVQKKLTYVGKKELVNLSTIMYYQDAVLSELKSIKSIPNSYLDTGGLKIYTNLDLAAQTALENNIKETIPEDSEVQVASVMMEPHSGKIIALTGGVDYNKSQFNRATQAKRQVGSTMKPYLYYAALENGFTPSTTFTSEQTVFNFSDNKTYSPQNYNEKYGNKPISMAAAIAYSDNIYAVKTHMFLGEDVLVNMAKRVGITSTLEPVPSLALGTGEIGIIEMTAGYSAFANLGNKVKPYLISKVEDAEGKVLFEAKEEVEAALNKNLTFILNNMLTSTYDSSFIDYNYPTAINLSAQMTHKYALKSGTTNTDSWYIGYNNQIVTSVWVGYDDNKEVGSTETKYTQQIWLKTIEAYEQDKKDEWYQQPDSVVAVVIDPISGKPATNESTKKKVMYFLKGSEPSFDDPVFDEIVNSKEQ